MFDQGIVLCVCFPFCASLCRCFWPKHFWHSDNLQDGECCNERNALWNCEECPIQVWSGTICVSLKMWVPWKALSSRENLASHTLPNSGDVVWDVFPRAHPCGPSRPWLTEQASFIWLLEIRTHCLIKKAKSQLSKQDFQIKWIGSFFVCI